MKKAMKKRARVCWMVKVYQGYKKGWVILNTYATPAAAEEVITRICREQGVPCTDFIIKRMEID